MERKKLVERSRQSFTRLARFINQLMREQLFCGPVTVQQCYTPLHQSTLTRVVEKLERQNLVSRTRKLHNQRSVEVQITETGKQTYVFLERESMRMISDLLDLIPKDRRASIVEAMEVLASLLNPENEAFQKLLKGCRCGISDGGSEK
jgi:DNA-binding MarR family transcriptional regulator